MGGHRMTHPIIAAAGEFYNDERRREKRGQKPRMPDPLVEAHLRAGIAAINSTATPSGIDSQSSREARGEVAVEIFGYRDTFNEKAATVITDILHAVASRGYNPQAALDQAAAYYAEEKPR